MDGRLTAYTSSWGPGPSISGGNCVSSSPDGSGPTKNATTAATAAHVHSATAAACDN